MYDGDEESVMVSKLPTPVASVLSLLTTAQAWDSVILISVCVCVDGVPCGVVSHLRRWSSVLRPQPLT